MILPSETWLCPFCRGRHSIADCDELDDFGQYHNDVRAMVDFLDRGDYPGLVSYFEDRIARQPDDDGARQNLGDAYALNRQYDRAIVVLEDLHRRRPDDEDVQRTILDALFGQGQDETHFQWTEKPAVLRLTHGVLNRCYRYLKPKREPRDVDDLFCDALGCEYCAFTEEDLLEALRGDRRFVIEEDVWPRIRVRSPAIGAGDSRQRPAGE